MTDTTLSIPATTIVLRASHWRDIAAALDQLPNHIDNPGLDALMNELAGRGLLDDAA